MCNSGDNASDLELSDAGSLTSSSDEESSDEDEDGRIAGLASLSASSSTTSFPLLSASVSTASVAAERLAEQEFQAEVRASLARAFAEEHSVDNAAVELKTLRMASNVPLRRVHEAVVGALVELIPIVAGDAPRQRAEIARVVDRWGALIVKIGGADSVDTVSILQVRLRVCVCVLLLP